MRPGNMYYMALAFIPAFFGSFRFLRMLFFEQARDPDIDAFLYIGSRLWRGELLYFKDFETKLPFLQYLFAIAIEFGGVGAWRIITFFVVVLLGLGASIILTRDFVDRAGSNRHNINILAVLSFGIFLVLIYSLPGSKQSQIEMVSAAGAYMSLALLVAHPKARKPGFFLFFSGVALSFAALVRPNYIFVIPVSLLFLLLDKRAPSAVFVLLLRAAAFLLGFGVFTVLSFTPYMLQPLGPTVLIDGLGALSSYDNAPSLGRQIMELLGYSEDQDIWFYLVLGALAVLGLRSMWIKRSSVANDTWMVVCTCYVSIAAVVISLMVKHYWAHNQLMLAPYAIPLFLNVWTMLEPIRLQSKSIQNATLAGSLASLLIFSLYQPWALFTAPEGFNPDINRSRVDRSLLTFLEESQKGGLTFLAVDMPIYHALLGEPRVGDGHPAMLSNALNGQRVGPLQAIPVFAQTGEQAACRALLAATKDILVLTKTSDLSTRVKDCTATSPDLYRVLSETGEQTILRRNRS